MLKMMSGRGHASAVGYSAAHGLWWQTAVRRAEWYIGLRPVTSRTPYGHGLEKKSNPRQLANVGTWSTNKEVDHMGFEMPIFRESRHRSMWRRVPRSFSLQRIMNDVVWKDATELNIDLKIATAPSTVAAGLGKLSIESISDLLPTVCIRHRMTSWRFDANVVE